jgi:hypothetical protein
VSIITRRPVTLTIEETETLLSILKDFSAANWAHSRRTKSAAVRGYCEQRARASADLDAEIIRRLYVHVDEGGQS